MTSLIFWGPYLAHKSVVNHRREKQRVKNYERWEGLRDEYDDQRKVARETRSLDIQRTGAWDANYEQGGVLSLRDQQEANDARTSWRPQESWDTPKTQIQAQMTGQHQQPQFQQPQMSGHPQHQYTDFQSQTTSQYDRRASASPNPFGHLPLKSQKTGAAWDEGLPAPLQVSRRSFDDYEYPTRQGRTSSQTTSRSQSRQQSISGISRTHTPSGLRESVQIERHSPELQVTMVQEMPKNEFGFVEPVRQVAGGRMAELIERGY